MQQDRTVVFSWAPNLNKVNFRIPLLFGLLAISLPISARDFTSTLQELTDAGWHVSEPLTVEAVESQSLADLRDYLEKANARKDVPLVPFGYANAEWLIFKKQIRPMDQLVLLMSPAESWGQLAGWRGYAIVRDGAIVDSFVTEIN